MISWQSSLVFMFDSGGGLKRFGDLPAFINALGEIPVGESETRNGFSFKRGILLCLGIVADVFRFENQLEAFARLQRIGYENKLIALLGIFKGEVHVRQKFD